MVHVCSDDMYLMLLSMPCGSCFMVSMWVMFCHGGSMSCGSRFMLVHVVHVFFFTPRGSCFGAVHVVHVGFVMPCMWFTFSVV